MDHCLSFPHTIRCDVCHQMTVTTQSYDGAPEYIVVDTPRHHYSAEGTLQVDSQFPGIFHETKRPTYFNGAPYLLTAIICCTPNHFVTVIPRGRSFLCVDDALPVRVLRQPELVQLFAATTLTFLARLHSRPTAQVRFAPTTVPILDALAPLTKAHLTTTDGDSVMADAPAAAPTAAQSSDQLPLDTPP